MMSHHTPDGNLPYPDDMPPPSYESVCNDNSSAPAALRSNTGTTTQSTIQPQANHSVHQSQSCQCQCHETHSPARSALAETAQTSTSSKTHDSPGASWVYKGSRSHFPYWEVSSPSLSSSFGISESTGRRPKANDKGPDFFFTCNVQPRKPSISRSEILFQCRMAAEMMRGHRSVSRYTNDCGCTFESIRGCRGLTAWLVVKAMKNHDKLCACGCFAAKK